uniref:Cnidarian restricted protein n=1 Tax=Clytia hemisphaerica TaxID=252671 RepID=A0A7M5X0W8_9CNID
MGTKILSLVLFLVITNNVAVDVDGHISIDDGTKKIFSNSSFWDAFKNNVDVNAGRRTFEDSRKLLIQWQQEAMEQLPIAEDFYNRKIKKANKKENCFTYTTEEDNRKITNTIKCLSYEVSAGDKVTLGYLCQMLVHYFDLDIFETEAGKDEPTRLALQVKFIIGGYPFEFILTSAPHGGRQIFARFTKKEFDPEKQHSYPRLIKVLDKEENDQMVVADTILRVLGTNLGGKDDVWGSMDDESKEAAMELIILSQIVEGATPRKQDVQLFLSRREERDNLLQLLANKKTKLSEMHAILKDIEKKYSDAGELIASIMVTNGKVMDLQLEKMPELKGLLENKQYLKVSRLVRTFLNDFLLELKRKTGEKEATVNRIEKLFETAATLFKDTEDTIEGGKKLVYETVKSSGLVSMKDFNDILQGLKVSGKTSKGKSKGSSKEASNEASSSSMASSSSQKWTPPDPNSDEVKKLIQLKTKYIAIIDKLSQKIITSLKVASDRIPGRLGGAGKWVVKLLEMIKKGEIKNKPFETVFNAKNGWFILARGGLSAVTIIKQILYGDQKEELKGLDQSK